MSKKKLLFGGIGAQNTFIGGIGGTINTPQLLATRLDIAVNRISNFEIVGSEVRCRIAGTFSFPISPSGFSLNTNITFYNDKDNLGISLGDTFNQCTNVKSVLLNGVVSVDAYQTLRDCTSLRVLELKAATSITGAVTIPFAKVNNCVIYIPNCTNLGGTVGNNAVFTNVGSGNILYAHPSLQTNNAGNPDGDITAFLAVAGNTVRYVTNFTPPAKVTNITAGNTYNTAIQINFTAPTSTNAIDYYELYVNGVYRQNIVSGQFVTGLLKNTAFNIQIKTIDIFYNDSMSDGVLLSTANIDYTVNTSTTEATTFITATGISDADELSSTRQLFFQLINKSLYNKIQAGWLMKGGIYNSCKFNIKNPVDTNAGFRFTAPNGGNYAGGFTGNGTNQYLDTFFVPSANQNVNSNGLTIVVGTNNAVISAFRFHGCVVSSTQETLITEKRDNTNFGIVMAINSDAGFISVTGTNNARGILTGMKVSATVAKLAKNGSIIGTSNIASGTLPNINIFLSAYNSAGTSYGHSNQRLQMAFMHEGLTDGEVIQLHEIIDASETIANRKTW